MQPAILEAKLVELPLQIFCPFGTGLVRSRKEDDIDREGDCYLDCGSGFVPFFFELLLSFADFALESLNLGQLEGFHRRKRMVMGGMILAMIVKMTYEFWIDLRG